MMLYACIVVALLYILGLAMTLTVWMYENAQKLCR